MSLSTDWYGQEDVRVRASGVGLFNRDRGEQAACKTDCTFTLSFGTQTISSDISCTAYNTRIGIATPPPVPKKSTSCMGPRRKKKAGLVSVPLRTVRVTRYSGRTDDKPTTMATTMFHSRDHRSHCIHHRATVKEEAITCKIPAVRASTRAMTCRTFEGTFGCVGHGDDGKRRQVLHSDTMKISTKGNLRYEFQTLESLMIKGGVVESRNSNKGNAHEGDAAE